MNEQKLSEQYKQKLERNIIKYSWFKIFTKRVYLPLITIQLVGVGGVTIEQLALIVSITAVLSFILQMPSGYIADKYGNKFAILFGAVFIAISPIFYIVMPNFIGGLLASLLFFGGFAFQSGALEAFMHDTLVALGREKEYSKIMGRAQSYGLIGYVILITLVPATYAINTNLPFAIGIVTLLIMLWLAANFAYPPSSTKGKRTSPLSAAKSIVTVRNIALFLFAGFMGGIAFRGGEYRELLFQDIGVAVSLFGLIIAAGSLAGAAMGWYLHKLDSLQPRYFYLLDLLFIVGSFIFAGMTANPYVVVGIFVLFIGYNRVRLIVFQSKLLQDIRHTYKATLLSALNLFSTVGEIVAIAILTKAIGLTNYSEGYLLFGLVSLGIGMLLWTLVARSENKSANA